MAVDVELEHASTAMASSVAVNQMTQQTLPINDLYDAVKQWKQTTGMFFTKEIYIWCVCENNIYVDLPTSDNVFPLKR